MTAAPNQPSSARRAEYRKAVRTYYGDARRPYVDRPIPDSTLSAVLRGTNQLGPASTFLRAESRLVVVGAPGTGKTTLLDRYAMELSSAERGVPIFVSLHRFVTTMAELLDSQVDRFVPGLSFRELLRTSAPDEMVFLLDGADEVAPPLHARFTSELLGLVQRHPTARFIVTSRRAGFENTESFPSPEWKVIELLPLSDAEVDAVLRDVGLSAFAPEIMARPELREFARRPLFLHTVVNAIREGGDPRLYLFNAASNYVLWRGHARSDLPRAFPTDLLDRALQVLAMQMVRQKAFWLPRAQVEALLATDPELSAPELLAAIQDIDPIEVHADEWRFRHLSYQESYCARYLLSAFSRESVAVGDLRAVLDSPSGAEILRAFLAQMEKGEKRRFFSSLSAAALAEVLQLIPEEAAEVLRPREQQTSAPPIVEALEAVRRAEARVKPRRDIVVFAIHGFNTRGPWKNNLSPLLNRETDDVRYIYAPWDYGDFRTGILNPIARAKKVAEFHQYYNDVLEKYADSRSDVPKPVVCVVAHSFGTYIVARALLKYDEVRFDRIVLLRCLLPRKFPWSLAAEKCGEVLSEVGKADWALIGAMFIPGLGSAGRAGFVSPPAFVRESISSFGDHSSVFGALHMRDVWIPFFRSAAIHSGSTSRLT